MNLNATRFYGTTCTKTRTELVCWFWGWNSSLSGDDFIAEKFLSYEQKRVGENREIEYSRNQPLNHKPNNILKRHTK